MASFPAAINSALKEVIMTEVESMAPAAAGLQKKLILFI